MPAKESCYENLSDMTYIHANPQCHTRQKVTYDNILPLLKHSSFSKFDKKRLLF